MVRLMAKKAAGNGRTFDLREPLFSEHGHNAQRASDADVSGIENADAVRARRAEEDHNPYYLPQLIQSTRKPRDLVWGTSSALKTMAKSAVVGAALPALSVVNNVKQVRNGEKGAISGVLGAATGAALNSLVGAGVIARGAAVGTYQVARGAVNTPLAIQQGALKGKRWNSTERRWESKDSYTLEGEHAQVMADWEKFYKLHWAANHDLKSDPDTQGPSRSRSNMRWRAGEGAEVWNDLLYKQLGVNVNASEAQIRRAYRVLSLRYHPDKQVGKSPEDKAAAWQNFQQVSEAYQTLSDAEKRAKYDASGQNADEQAADTGNVFEFVDPQVLFTSMFGSDKFERFLGKRGLVALGIDSLQEIEWEEKAFGTFVMHEETSVFENLKEIRVLARRAKERLNYYQKERQVDIAEGLVNSDPNHRQNWILHKFVDDVEQSKSRVPFTVEESYVKAMESMIKEEKEMLEAPHAAEILREIGWTYRNTAKRLQSGNYLAQVKHSGQAAMKKRVDGRSLLRSEWLADLDKASEQIDKEVKEVDEAKEEPLDASAANKKKNKIMMRVLDENSHIGEEAAWWISLYDARETSRAVAEKICRDAGVSEDVRNSRIRALMLLGKWMMNVAAGEEKKLARINISQTRTRSEERVEEKKEKAGRVKEGIKSVTENAFQKMAAARKER